MRPAADPSVGEGRTFTSLEQPGIFLGDFFATGDSDITVGSKRDGDEPSSFRRESTLVLSEASATRQTEQNGVSVWPNASIWMRDELGLR